MPAPEKSPVKSAPKPPARTEYHAKPAPQMATEEHLRSVGTLVDPPVKLPAMTTAQLDSLETALTGVRRNERPPIMRAFLAGL